MKMFGIRFVVSVQTMLLLMIINSGDTTRSDRQQTVDDEASLSFEDLQNVYLGSLKRDVATLAKNDMAKKSTSNLKLYEHVLKTFNEIESYLKDKQLFISFIEDYCRVLKAEGNVFAVLPPKEYQMKKDRVFIDRFIAVNEYLKGKSAFGTFADIIDFMEDAARNHPNLQALVDRLKSMRTTIVTVISAPRVVPPPPPTPTPPTSDGDVDSALEIREKQIQDGQPNATAGQDVSQVENALKLELTKQDHPVTKDQNSPIVLKEQELEQIDQKQNGNEEMERDKVHKHKEVKATVFKWSLKPLTGTELDKNTQHRNGCFINSTADQYDTRRMIPVYVSSHYVLDVLNGTCYGKINVQHVEISCVDKFCEMKITNSSEHSSDNTNDYQEWCKELIMVMCSIGALFFAVVYGHANLRPRPDPGNDDDHDHDGDHDHDLDRPRRHHIGDPEGGYVRQPHQRHPRRSNRKLPNFGNCDQ